MNLSELKINKTWTLFLDRDGVINLHYPNDYVKTWDEFYFLEGALDAIRDLSQLFRRIIIVTNQQGVGREIMSQEDLDFIHAEMMREVRKHGGRIHAIYSATELRERDVNQMRKPAIGMAKKAKRDFPEIDFSKALIVGDAATDMQFGRAAGIFTVFVGDKKKLNEPEQQQVDTYCDSLRDFANSLKH
ncbi:MAG: HAD-IIIA family hydrolase [Bacteroidetes bacterium]|nr:HAD-IIIA family hydrolase [Bacteroidota bacterium]